MAGWLTAALKAVLPHVGDIVAATKPAFTKKLEPAANQDLVQQQIAELQSAVSQQASHIKELAAQLANTIETLEKAAQVAEARLRRVLIFTAVAAAVAVASLGVAFLAVMAR
jgi:hypothetical protein